MAYAVSTEKFQGPLEVLLQMIEERKLAITEISLAEVTQHFLEYIKSLQNIDPGILVDFLSVASKLLIIKSRSLLPSLDEELDEQEEASDLAYQLIQYKKFKEVCKYLRSIEAKGACSFARQDNSENFVHFYPDPSVDQSRLRACLIKLAKSLEDIISLPKQIVKEVVSIAEKIRDIQNALTQRVELKLSEALKNKDRTETVVTFLALLELVKQRILTVEQEALFSDISIKRNQV